MEHTKHLVKESPIHFEDALTGFQIPADRRAASLLVLNCVWMTTGAELISGLLGQPFVSGDKHRSDFDAISGM